MSKLPSHPADIVRHEDHAEETVIEKELRLERLAGVFQCRGKTPGSPVLRCMKHAHDEKLRFCDMLEQIADALPNDVDRFKCLTVANALAPLMRSVHRFEEEVVFPAYSRDCEENCSASLQRLATEHMADECFADEITEVLLSMGHGSPVENPEAVGFMLRGFFDSVRRHVAFEREHILPVIAAHEAV